MAAAPVNRAALPGEAELRAFAHTAAHLLAEKVPLAGGARATTRRAGVGLQHLDHRDYVPGDEVRHIDWRQTARRRRPIVRRFESESVSDWTILLDASSSMAVNGAAKWRAAVQAAAAMAYALLTLGHRAGLVAFGARVLAECPRGRGMHHYAAMARLLLALQPAGAGERSEIGVCAPHLHGGVCGFGISDCLADDEMRRELGALVQRCRALHVLQLTDPAETQLEASGEFDLRDVETGLRLQIRAGADSARLASARRAAMTARLRSYCARGGIAFSDWPLGLPWQQVLLRHLVQAGSSC